MPDVTDINTKKTRIARLPSEATRVEAFGFGLDDATIEQTQSEGGILDLIAAKIDRGYGLISMARISVAGE